MSEETAGGVVGRLAGKVKEVAGEATGQEDLAREGRLEGAELALFHPLKFMLASPAEDAVEIIDRLGPEVWVEDKYDGIRAQLHKGGRDVRLYSRDLHDVSGQFPEIVDFWLPPEGCSYRVAVVTIRKAYPGHAKRVMLGVWSYLRQFTYTKFVIVTDDDIDARGATAGQLVGWSVTAADPNEDALTFSWNFGDGTTRTTTQTPESTAPIPIAQERRRAHRRPAPA